MIKVIGKAMIRRIVDCTITFERLASVVKPGLVVANATNEQDQHERDSGHTRQDGRFH